MTKEEFLEMVIAEVEAIKKNATVEEIDGLNFNCLKPNNSKECIYGQMTGDCHNKRATELIWACKTKCLNSLFGETFEDINEFLDGIIEPNPSSRHNYTPLEYYISMKEAKNEQIIAYLKGETNTLEL